MNIQHKPIIKIKKNILITGGDSRFAVELKKSLLGFLIE